MNLDDPRLTAFALDELDEPEKSNVARAIESSPEARRAVDEIRSVAKALRSEFAAEVKGRPPASPASECFANHAQRSLTDIRGDRWFWTVARPLALAAALAVLGLIVAIVFGGRHVKITTPQSPTTEIELVDGSPREKSPDSLPNPLQIELIDSVDHVVIGEMPDQSGTNGAPMRVIEVVRDSARLTKLKARLTTQKLQNVARSGTAVPGYQMVFLDSAERMVACVRFDCGKATGAVLHLIPTAAARDGHYFPGAGSASLPGDWQSHTDYSSYAIPFPDWREAIGYCPGVG